VSPLLKVAAFVGLLAVTFAVACGVGALVPTLSF
jgi:hypothetical protein